MLLCWLFPRPGPPFPLHFSDLSAPPTLRSRRPAPQASAFSPLDLLMGKHKKSWRCRSRQKLACSSLERHIPGGLYTTHRCPNLLGAHFSSWGAGPQVAAPPLNMTYGTHHTAVTVPLYTC